MEKSNKRGKIPQADWPLIMARYEAGETLASIARTYDCSPPAISYIVSRNRDKPANETVPQPAPEPMLIKTHAIGSLENGAEPQVVATAPLAEAPPPIRRDSVERPAGAPAPQPSSVAHGNGEPRQKLHLGFGNGNGNGNGNGHGSMPESRPQQAPPPPAQRPLQAPPRINPFDNGHGNRDFAAPRETRPAGQMAPQMPRDDAPARKDSGAALDQELRSRVDGDITAFLAAFDAVLATDSQESRLGLREATDRLLRAGARTRIELERLEAKVPLPPRDGGGHAEPAGWRYR
jgi:hypothetical protein